MERILLSVAGVPVDMVVVDLERRMEVWKECERAGVEAMWPFGCVWVADLVVARRGQYGAKRLLMALLDVRSIYPVKLVVMRRNEELMKLDPIHVSASAHGPQLDEWRRTTPWKTLHPASALIEKWNRFIRDAKPKTEEQRSCVRRDVVDLERWGEERGYRRLQAGNGYVPAVLANEIVEAKSRNETKKRHRAS